MRGCSQQYHETLDLTDSVDTALIDPPKNKLRNYDEGIEELVSSIRNKGLIQPIIVRPVEDRFEVVAGARRFEACRKLRWRRVPCIIRNIDDRTAFEISLTENIQRRTMGAIEEAEAFKRYIDLYGWGGESDLARKIGKSQEYVSQRLALLSLARKIKGKVIRRQISPSVAQEIARLENPRLQEAVSEQVVKHSLTVKVVRHTVTSLIKEKAYVRGRATNYKREVDETRISDARNDSAIEPDFIIHRNTGESESKTLDMKSIEKAILVLKLAMSRLELLIDDLPRRSQVRDLLMNKRLTIHEMIGTLIASKMDEEREEVSPVVRR